MAVDFPVKVIHGGTGKLQHEKTHKYVLDFSASVNPFTPDVGWDPRDTDFSRYPDDSYSALKTLIARTFRRRTEEICVGNGSIELLRVYCLIAAPKGSRYYIPAPTFGEYALSAELSGAIRTDNENEADLSFICNPNNPTGTLLARKEIAARLGSMKEHRGRIFCDEAFIELADPAQSCVDIADPDLFVLRSLTKCFAVPGLRLGYGFGDPDLVAKMETVRPPWSVNAAAEAFAMAALPHMDELKESRARIAVEREWLTGSLTALGFTVNPSSANYLLLDYRRPVTALCGSLEEKGILVRDCTSFGLPTCIRVAVRTREENRQLIGALTSCLP